MTGSSLPSSPGLALKILLVEDNPDDVYLLEQLLRQTTRDWYTLTQVESLQAALQSVQEQAYDMVLLDLSLPDSWGLATFAKLRARSPAIPLVVLTGNEDEELAVQAVAQGAQDYLLKGEVSADTLRRAIRYAVTRYQLEQELRQSLEIQQTISNNLIQTGNELGRSQRRLMRLLDIAEEAILTVDENHCIHFFNQSAEQLFGYTFEEVAGQSLARLVTPDALSRLAQLSTEENPRPNTEQSLLLLICPKLQPPRAVQTLMRPFVGEEEISWALIFQGERREAPGKFPALRMVSASAGKSELDRERQRIHALEEAFSGLFHLFAQGGQELLHELRTLDHTLTGVTESLAEEQPTLELRETVVRVVGLSLLYWEQTTHKSKVDLAQESGLWQAYLDKSTYRTKTLDRYLNLQTLPQRPRWKEVVATATYVLTHCPPLEPAKSQLESAVLQLQQLLGYVPR